MGEEKKTELSRKDMKDKLYNERKTYRTNLAKRDAEVKLAKMQMEKSVEEVKTAFHNLAAQMARTYGIELANGDYELHIPVPEGGWLTMGKKVDGEYVITAKQIK